MRLDGVASILSTLVEDLQWLPNCDPKRITQEEYEDWKKEFVFETLRNDIGVGQSFCEHFQIRDNILRLYRSVDAADKYIQRTYTKK